MEVARDWGNLEDMMNAASAIAFRFGYEIGNSVRREVTSREAWKRWSHLFTAETEDAFLQGTIDGAIGDTWRLNQLAS